MADPKLCENHEVINTNISYIKKAVDKMDTKFDNYIKDAKKEFSSKWVERLVTATLSAIGMIIIGGIMGLLIAPKAFAFAQVIAFNTY